MTNLRKCCLKPLKYGYVLLFTVLCHMKVIISGFWSDKKQIQKCNFKSNYKFFKMCKDVCYKSKSESLSFPTVGTFTASRQQGTDKRQK